MLNQRIITKIQIIICQNNNKVGISVPKRQGSSFNFFCQFETLYDNPKLK